MSRSVSFPWVPGDQRVEPASVRRDGSEHGCSGARGQPLTRRRHGAREGRPPCPQPCARWLCDHVHLMEETARARRGRRAGVDLQLGFLTGLSLQAVGRVTCLMASCQPLDQESGPSGLSGGRLLRGGPWRWERWVCMVPHGVSLALSRQNDKSKTPKPPELCSLAGLPVRVQTWSGAADQTHVPHMGFG